MQIDVRPLIHFLNSNAVTLLHGLPRHAVALRVVQSDEVAFGGAGGDHHLEIVRIIIGRPDEGDHVG